MIKKIFFEVIICSVVVFWQSNVQQENGIIQLKIDLELLWMSQANSL